MNGKWLAWAAVVVFAATGVAWIARNTYWDEVRVPQLLQGEAATNPFYAASHLARFLGARARWQRVPGALPGPRAVIVLSNWNWGLVDSRRDRMQRWVEAGGRLVLDRTVEGGQRELEMWSGVSRVPRDGEATRAGNMRNGVECVILDADSSARGAGKARTQYQVCNHDRASDLRTSRHASWLLRDSGAAIQALRVPKGLGSITLVNAAPFGNLALLLGDDARLFVAATQLRAGDELWFMADTQGGSLLSLIWQVGAPVIGLAVVFIALWLWRAGTRFGPPLAPAPAARRSVAEQIRGTGQFTVRVGGGKALLDAQMRALREMSERRIAGYSHMPVPERVAALARLTGVDPGILSEAMTNPWPRRRGALRETLLLLESVRRAIDKQRKSGEGSSDAD